jgi:hypothetical protein
MTDRYSEQDVGYVKGVAQLPLSKTSTYAALLGGMAQVARSRDGASVHVEQMMQELAQLRRGHGLHAEDLAQRIGESLRLACGIAPEENTAAVRQKLIDRILETAETLPPDLRLAVQSAFALPPASQARFLKDRMAWLGERIDRDPRTAARRVHTGLGLLAERMAHATPQQLPASSWSAPDGWYLSRVRVVLRLTTDPVQLMEERVIVAARDALSEVPVSWSVPRGPASAHGPGIGADLVYGGRLVPSPGLSSPTCWAGRIILPRPLRAGERHEYFVNLTTVEPRAFGPCYVMSPSHRCDEFELRVTFDATDPPCRVMRICGTRDVLAGWRAPDGERVTIDDAGEVALTFSHLRQGLYYGVRWVP